MDNLILLFIMGIAFCAIALIGECIWGDWK
jgi:hypothetical protein